MVGMFTLLTKYVGNGEECPEGESHDEPECEEGREAGQQRGGDPSRETQQVAEQDRGQPTVSVRYPAEDDCAGD